VESARAMGGGHLRIILNLTSTLKNFVHKLYSSNKHVESS